jgi:arylsulfatase A-like enzyme
MNAIPRCRVVLLVSAALFAAMFCGVSGCGELLALRGGAGEQAQTDRKVLPPPVQPRRGPTVSERPDPTAPDAVPRDATAPDDVEQRPAAKTGLIRGLREQVESSQPFEEAGVVDPLLDMLTEADEILSQAKLRNMEAIRQANRQIRVGAARLSPHIILLVVDRLRKTDLGCYGNPRSVTPQMDLMAASGMRFTNCYAGGADPDAGLWALLTGKNPRHAPGTDSATYQLREDDQTLAEVLWRASYNTAFIGVWTGTQRPLQHGFDEWVGRLPTHDLAEAFPEVLLIGRSQMRIVENHGGQRRAGIHKLLQAEAESFIDRASSNSRPFLLVVRLPSAEVCRIVAGSQAPETALAVWDEFVGGILSFLSEKNLQRRTCVMFTALIGDASHLTNTGTSPRPPMDHPLTEGNLQVPLLVSWAGSVPRDRVSDHVCAAWDVAATCIELAHVSHRPPDLNGLSFVPALRQQNQPEHALLFWETRGTPRVQAVRKGTWKGVYIDGEKTLRLYNLAEDPQETTDVAAKHPEIVRQLIVPPAKPTKTAKARPQS